MEKEQHPDPFDAFQIVTGIRQTGIVIEHDPSDIVRERSLPRHFEAVFLRTGEIADGSQFHFFSFIYF